MFVVDFLSSANVSVYDFIKQFVIIYLPTMTRQILVNELPAHDQTGLNIHAGIWYWLSYWHTCAKKGTRGFTSNTLLIPTQEM